MSWISAELPPDIPEVCVERAASYYNLPTALLVSLLHVEGGKVGKVYPRSHGTYYGPGQLSNKWLPHFAQWGYDAMQLQHNACANVTASAYVLAYYKVREPTLVRAIARYNVGSLDSPAQISAGRRYASKVINNWWTIYNKWKVSDAPAP